MARDISARNVHFRVDFVVREVCTDGSIPDDELRYIQMGDELRRTDIFDYFNRVRDAVQVLFPVLGSVVVLFDSVGPNKIQVIKTLREITGLGLKETKEMAEAPLGTALLSFDDSRHAESVTRKLEAAGAKTAMRQLRQSDEEDRPINVPLHHVARIDRDAH